ncbi:NHLP leader peptide family RiPP precursor [Pannonibacter indicus]|jgi:hypothetical protein|uniref:NHLP leader peptide domain n=1 Tax=Pannonibacter indicus TaxID=466044 RepID=A0A0K6IC42_9HYPH|nr:NHLP leader peptide family RiPP precursor [Pannonibacter indicus]CUB00671.1 NHLP leader peptide domain [Pannonibacter indicus]
MSHVPDPMTQARQHIERALIEQAQSDEAFRKLLLQDPRAALKQLIGVDPIPGFKIRVLEEVPGEVVLVLPRAIAQDELPDEMLDYAAGGSEGNPCPDPRGGQRGTIVKIRPASSN